MENKLMIFENEAFGKVRTLNLNGEPWFVAADVCKALELGNPSMTVERLDDDEKGISTIDTLGGKQRMAIINEPGLYSLVITSRKPEAKAFKRWITHEVIPAIRKHGAYMTKSVLEQVLENPELVLLMGTDMFLTFDTWKNPEKILGEATLGVFYRGDKGEKAAALKQKETLEARGAKVILVHNDVIVISSTQMRRLLAFRCAGEFLPAGVLDYIREYNLYDTRTNWKNLPMDKLEQVVVSLLNPNRVRHVLGCRDTAVELAKRWGADPVDAARAGILHDITKALDGPLQLTLCSAYGKMLDDFSRKYPKTLHALTGSLVAQRIFGENEAVVSAIESHTTGKANMNLLETIIYVADYMEPNRDFPGVEELRRAVHADLNRGLYEALRDSIRELHGYGSPVHPHTQEALEYITKEIGGTES